MVDFDARWIYTGSKTRPPCEHYVYWNVLKRVYPIRPEVFEAYKDKMKAHEEDRGTSPENARNIQPINRHEIVFVGARYLGKIAALSVAVLSSLVVWAGS